jgi:hypothetical protein
MNLQLDGALWLLLLLVPLLGLQRGVHYEIQAILLLTIRRSDIVAVVFSVLFLPGVFVHEMGHFLVARILGVRTGRFSILPQQMGNGRLQLGYVETAPSDVLRDSLIGAAPLIFGALAVTLLARYFLGFDLLVDVLAKGDWDGLTPALKNIYGMPDFWLRFYLLFSISSTMLPSESDRKAWLPLALVMMLLLILGLLLGMGPWLLQNLAPGLNATLRALALVFGVSVSVHLLLLIPLTILRRMLSSMTGMRVQA